MNPAGRLSIRVRLTVGTLVLALVFFIATAVIMHALVKNLLEQSTASLLETDIAPYQAAIVNEPTDEADIPAQGQLIAVIDPSGTGHVSTLPSALRTELGPLTALAESQRQVAVGDSQYLVGVAHVRDSDGQWTIVAARDQSSITIVMSQLTTGLVIGIAVLVLAFGLLSWLLTGTALRPVEHLRRSAEQIVASGSDDLLPVSPAKDEIQQLATTLNRLIEDLRASVARERQMVSDASHEMRTPLAVLQGQLELLRTGDRSTVDDDIASAEQATTRLSHLVTDLLELSRLESGGVQHVCASLRELVDETGEAVDRARLGYTDREIDIKLDIVKSDSNAAFAAIRASVFGRVLDNLLNNAADAIGSHGRIDVVVHADHQTLELTVADTGTGISESFLPHAFDRFSRDADSHDHGAGLGLAIVAAAVRSSGGTVSLANRDTGGVIATVRLPLRPAAELDVPIR